ncbi:MAG: hypothetical protein GX325_04240 [Peptococcaceae bacterium]|nr:hypothetical protein [Peptococcaceae bacterium]
MDSSPLFFLQSIPESVGAFALSLALAKVPLRWGRIIVVGAMLSLIIFGIRATALPAGLHTVAGLLFIVIVLAGVAGVPPTKSFVVALASLILLAFLEVIITGSLITLFKIDYQQMLSENYLGWKLLTLPQAAILIILALLVSRYLKPIQEARRM